MIYQIFNWKEIFAGFFNVIIAAYLKIRLIWCFWTFLSALSLLFYILRNQEELVCFFILILFGGGAWVLFLTWRYATGVGMCLWCRTGLAPPTPDRSVLLRAGTGPVNFWCRTVLVSDDVAGRSQGLLYWVTNQKT